MNFTMINRRQVKQETNALLKTAHVSPKKMTALYLGISALLSISTTFLPSMDLLDLSLGVVASLEPLVIAGTFISIFVTLMLQVLMAGYVLYFMGISRHQEMEFSNLFDGFSFAGKIISLMIIEFFYTWLWSLLLVVPGIIAAYRYRFALLNLCDNPELTASEALTLSKQQTRGYKMQLVTLDVSFIPWMFLSQLPAIVFYGSAIEFSVFASVPLPSLLVQNVIAALWGLVVSCFYLPLYQTSEIAYFEIAKQSSALNDVDKNPQNKEIWE